VSQAPQTNGLEFWRAPAPGRAVMPGFAAAKPGTGQTATAIIAPASCRHDNCIGRCLIMQQLSDFALYSAPLRPLPAGSPAGPALHNRYVMQTGACQNSTPAPLRRRTPYTTTKACSRVLSSQPGLRQLRRLAPVCLPESPSGFPQVAAMPTAHDSMSFNVIQADQTLPGQLPP